MSERPKKPSTLARNVMFIGVGAVFLWAVLGVGIKWDRLLNLPERLIDIFGRMFLPPDWSFLPTAAEAMVESLAMAWVGTIIGALLSLPMGFLAARNVSGGILSTIARLILNAIRAVPELILAIVVFVPVAGLGAMAGALAIGVHSIGTLGKLTSEAIESIDPGPVEAARASGAGRLAQQRWGVMPQVLPEVIAFWLYRFEINLRAAAVLGIVGAGGVGALLANTLTYRRWEAAGMTVLVVIVGTIIVDQVSGWVRRRIIEGSDSRPAAEEDLMAETDVAA
jgi:phosphonate transport system permease protein